jgi:hypothetical protein
MGAHNGNRQATLSFQPCFVHVCKLVLVGPIVRQDTVEDSLQGDEQPVDLSVWILLVRSLHHCDEIHFVLGCIIVVSTLECIKETLYLGAHFLGP